MAGNWIFTMPQGEYDYPNTIAVIAADDGFPTWLGCQVNAGRFRFGAVNVMY